MNRGSDNRGRGSGDWNRGYKHRDRGSFGRNSRGGYGDSRDANFRDDGPLKPFGTFLHTCRSGDETVAVCSTSDAARVPMFNAPVYNERGALVGKVQEVFGPLNAHYFTFSPETGVQPSSFERGTVFQIREGRTLPLTKFTSPEPKPVKSAQPRGGARGPKGRPQRGPAPRNFKGGDRGDRGDRGGYRGGPRDYSGGQGRFSRGGDRSGGREGFGRRNDRWGRDGDRGDRDGRR